MRALARQKSAQGNGSRETQVLIEHPLQDFFHKHNSTLCVVCPIGAVQAKVHGAQQLILGRQSAARRKMPGSRRDRR